MVSLFVFFLIFGKNGGIVALFGRFLGTLFIMILLNILAKE